MEHPALSLSAGPGRLPKSRGAIAVEGGHRYRRRLMAPHVARSSAACRWIATRIGQLGATAHPKRRRILAALGAVALVASACSSSPSRPSFTAGPTAMVQATTVGSLGKILVDGHGITLYMFVPDHHSGHSTCYSFCALEWPPLILPAGTTVPEAGPGINRALLGTTRRDGGALQVTYAGWPLYRWYGDNRPGSTSGQGLANAGGLWYVLRPSGSPET